MQGKEASEQETQKCIAGIDVSKSWLDAHALPSSESLRVANTTPGIRQLKRWLLKHRVDLVAVEATGRLHREVSRSLAASQIAVAVTNPFKVRMFAKAAGIAAKTDRLDAKVLALFASAMSPVCRPPAPKMLEAVQELVTARASATKERTALKNQRSAATNSFLKAQLRQRINQVAVHIKALEKECRGLIKADDGLDRRFMILTSIPSFGTVVAMTLIAFMSELGTMTNKSSGALAGVVPVADDSGQRQGVRVVWGGRNKIRKALYLAALSATSCNKDLMAFYQRLLENGKAKKAALIAVARKLLILANVLISEDRLWQQKRPQNA